MENNYNMFNSFYFFNDNFDLNSINYEEMKNEDNFGYEFEIKNDYFKEEKEENILKKKRTLIDEKTKKQIKLIRNRESAKKSRLKMKSIFNNLKQENILLKYEINQLKIKNQKYLNFIENNICKDGKEKYKKESQKLFIVYNNNLFNSRNSSNFNLSSLSSFITVVLCIFVLLFYNYNYSNTKLYSKRLLKETNKYSDIPISTFLNDTFHKNKTYILMSDYYSFSHIITNNFLGEKFYRFENKGKIRIVKDVELYDFFIKGENCENCLVEITKEYINLYKDDPMQFTLYIPTNNAIKSINNNEIEIKNIPDSKYIEVYFKIIGYKQGNLLSKNIN